MNQTGEDAMVIALEPGIGCTVCGNAGNVGKVANIWRGGRCQTLHQASDLFPQSYRLSKEPSLICPAGCSLELPPPSASLTIPFHPLQHPLSERGFWQRRLIRPRPIISPHSKTLMRCSQYDPNRYRRQDLERELRRLKRDLARVDVRIDALGAKGRLLETAKNRHLANMPLAIGQVFLSNLGLQYLPPVARHWYYQHQEYLRGEEQLKQLALQLHTERQVICSQLYQIEIQIEMLQYQP